MKGKKQWKAAVILLFVIVCGAFYLRIQDSGGNVEFQPESQYTSEEKQETGAEIEGHLEDRPADAKEQIAVHVCGEVCQEGVYRLPAGARVIDAIEAAGGLTEAAAGDALNQAGFLEDGVRVYIPSKEEAEAARACGQALGPAQAEDSVQPGDLGKININQAGREELMALPGIGESKADAILSYREEKGRFYSTEELMQVPGIKEGVFRKIEEKITVGQ